MATTGYILNQFFTTTLNVGGGIDNSQTTGIVITSVSGIDINKPGIALLSYTDPLNTANAEWITYTSIDGSNELQGVTRAQEGFSAKAHANGVSVAFPLSESHINNLVAGLAIGGSYTNIAEGVLDEDDFATNSATKIPTQQSAKAYVDSAIQTATDGATVTFDLGTGAYRKHLVVLGGNRTLALSNAQVGQVFIIMLTQDSTGSRTVTWFAGGTDTVTMTIAAPGVVTTTLDLKTGTPVIFTTTGALPTGITASTTYYWIRQSATTGNVASSKANALAGTAITTSGSQSGTHTMKPQILWAGGTAPTLTTSKHATDTFGFVYKSTGTIQGYVVGQDV